MTSKEQNATTIVEYVTTIVELRAQIKTLLAENIELKKGLGTVQEAVVSIVSEIGEKFDLKVEESESVSEVKKKAFDPKLEVFTPFKAPFSDAEEGKVIGDSAEFVAHPDHPNAPPGCSVCTACTACR